MKKKLAAIVVAFVMTVALAACGAGKETTLTGMVVSVDGTVISLMEMDSEMSGKASGSMDDITAGTFVTITMNGKGQVTNVVVSSMSGLGGRIPTN